MIVMSMLRWCRVVLPKAAPVTDDAWEDLFFKRRDMCFLFGKRESGPSQEENEAGEVIGGWGWVPAYVDFEISPGDYRNPLKFKVCVWGG